ncbi:MAG: mucoidy inhibitor MuiA family protein [Opitutia bacterium]
MRPALLLLALASTLEAAEITADGRITAVTVYADRAEVTRQARLRLEPGSHTVVFDRLPANVDTGSLRATGKGGFTLVDIRPDTVQTTEVANEKVAALTERLRGLERQAEELKRAEGRVEARRQALAKVLDRLTTAGKDSPGPEMDPAKWSGFIDFHAGALAKLDEESLGLRDKAKEVAKDADQVRRELAALQAGSRKVRQVARLTVEAAAATEAVIDLSYVVGGPSWEPSYDIRAEVAAKTVEVAYFATVRQSTGEDWKGVALRLSTAQPSVHGREPELDPWFVRKSEPIISRSAPASVRLPLGEMRAAPKAQMFNEFALTGATADAMVPAGAAVARVIPGGVAAVFAVERAADIASDNKPVRASLSRDTFPAAFRHTCVPKLSPHTYLKAKAINKTELPYLPGPSAVFVDGSFVANADMDLVPAGQEFWTYLGADASVKVERRILADRTEVSGLIGKKTVSTVRDHVFKLTNGKPTPVELVIWDQVPMSNHEAIKVTLEQPEYRKDTADLRMDDQKRLEWRVDLKPGEKRDLPFRFTVERPEDLVVEGL